MKTGTIILVSGQDDQARLIQKFQSKADKESGKYNHSGILIETKHGIYVAEESYIKGRKLRAAVVISPLSKYQDGKHELLYLVPCFDYDEAEMERIILSYTGTPYDYWSLLHDQVIRTLGGEWVGRKGAEAARRMVCHEYGQKCWHDFGGENDPIFPEWYTGDVSKTFHSPYFWHKTEL